MESEMNMGNYLVKKARFVYWSVFLLAAGVFPLFIAVVVFVQSPWVIFVTGGWFILLCYMAYLRLVKKREPKYPLVPPEGKPDVYTGLVIPRPVHEDFDEMKRRRQKLRRMSKRKKH